MTASCLLSMSGFETLLRYERNDATDVGSSGGSVALSATPACLYAPWQQHGRKTDK